MYFSSSWMGRFSCGPVGSSLTFLLLSWHPEKALGQTGSLQSVESRVIQENVSTWEAQEWMCRRRGLCTLHCLHVPSSIVLDAHDLLTQEWILHRSIWNAREPVEWQTLILRPVLSQNSRYNRSCMWSTQRLKLKTCFSSSLLLAFLFCNSIQ